MGFKTFEEIKAWQFAMDYAVFIADSADMFPQKEQFGIADQIKRCSLSISSNIAEGFGKKTNTDFKRFLFIAQGSLFESKSQLIYCLRRKFISKKEYDKLRDVSNSFDALLSALIRSIK